MNNLRKHGYPPYKVAVIHGGPGAPGEMAPLARQLAFISGVLEPLQTADTLEGQLEELVSVLERYSSTPVKLLGFSWGAMLAFIATARRPELVEKLILISSPPFEEKYADYITIKRFERLNTEERAEVNYIIREMENPSTWYKDELFGRLGKLLAFADSFKLTDAESEVLEYQYGLYNKVWPQAVALRRKGLLEMATRISCPVVAIHGNYDPHPAEGVGKPLSEKVNNFRLVLLENCGHYPWRERLAKDKFLEILTEEIRLSN